MLEGPRSPTPTHNHYEDYSKQLMAVMLGQGAGMTAKNLSLIGRSRVVGTPRPHLCPESLPEQTPIQRVIDRRQRLTRPGQLALVPPKESPGGPPALGENFCGNSTRSTLPPPQQTTKTSKKLTTASPKADSEKTKKTSENLTTASPTANSEKRRRPAKTDHS